MYASCPIADASVDSVALANGATDKALKLAALAPTDKRNRRRVTSDMFVMIFFLPAFLAANFLCT
jgi:hypothetical protein